MSVEYVLGLAIALLVVLAVVLVRRDRRLRREIEAALGLEGLDAVCVPRRWWVLESICRRRTRDVERWKRELNEALAINEIEDDTMEGLIECARKMETSLNRVMDKCRDLAKERNELDGEMTKIQVDLWGAFEGLFFGPNDEGMHGPAMVKRVISEVQCKLKSWAARRERLEVIVGELEARVFVAARGRATDDLLEAVEKGITSMVVDREGLREKLADAEQVKVLALDELEVARRQLERFAGCETSTDIEALCHLAEGKFRQFRNAVEDLNTAAGFGDTPPVAGGRFGAVEVGDHQGPGNRRDGGGGAGDRAA